MPLLKTLTRCWPTGASTAFTTQGGVSAPRVLCSVLPQWFSPRAHLSEKSDQIQRSGFWEIVSWYVQGRGPYTHSKKATKNIGCSRGGWGFPLSIWQSRWGCLTWGLQSAQLWTVGWMVNGDRRGPVMVNVLGPGPGEEPTSGQRGHWEAGGVGAGSGCKPTSSPLFRAAQLLSTEHIAAPL